MSLGDFFLLFQNILKFFNLRKKIVSAIYLIMSCLSGFTEIVSIGMVIPFISIMINPDLIQSFIYKYNISFDFVINLNSNLVAIYLSLILIFLILLSTIFRLSLFYVGQKITYSLFYDFNIIAYKKLLSIKNTYDKHLDSSEFLSIVEKIGSLSNFFISTLTIISNLIIFIFIFSFLLVLAPFEILILGFFFFAVYFLVIGIVNKRLHYNSYIESEILVKRNRHINDTIGFQVDLILNNCKKNFLKVFESINYKLTKLNVSNVLIAFFPGIIIVNLTIIILISYIFFQQVKYSSILNQIPTLSAIVYGSQKLIPLMQMIYSSLTKIKSNYFQTQDIISYLSKINVNILEKDLKKKILFKNIILLKKINFRHKKSSRYILKNLDLKIKKGDKILITGNSGSGKTTLINILLGFLSPTSGKLIVDNKNISEKYYKNFVHNFSYCPQRAYISDNSINTNIAVNSINGENIDNNKIILSTRIAVIDKYIHSLRLKFNSNISQDGKSISGGQAQRLSIARALYKESEIYIFDESTNALDRTIEEKILRNFNELLREKTVIFVAHKIRNNDYFDKVYELKNQKLSLIK